MRRRRVLIHNTKISLGGDPRQEVLKSAGDFFSLLVLACGASAGPRYQRTAKNSPSCSLSLTRRGRGGASSLTLLLLGAGRRWLGRRRPGWWWSFTGGPG